MAGSTFSSDRMLQGTAKGGGLYLAPVGSTMPSDATSSLDAAFYHLGYLVEDPIDLGGGVTVNPVEVYQSLTAPKFLATAQTFEWSVTCKETEPEVIGQYFGITDPTEVSGAFSWTMSGTPTVYERAVVFDWQDGTKHLRLGFYRVNISRSNFSAPRDNIITWSSNFNGLADPDNSNNVGVGFFEDTAL